MCQIARPANPPETKPGNNDAYNAPASGMDKTYKVHTNNNKNIQKNNIISQKKTPR